MDTIDVDEASRLLVIKFNRNGSVQDITQMIITILCKIIMVLVTKNIVGRKNLLYILE